MKGYWGDRGLHAIGSAGAVRGRSTGGRSGHSEPHCARHRLRSGHRNTRKESADIATRHSPSAAERAPRSPCCTRGNSSSSSKAIAIRAGRSRALVRRQTKRTREAYALLVLECSRSKSLCKAEYHAIYFRRQNPSRDWRRMDATAGENGARERLGRNRRDELERRGKNFYLNRS